SSSFRIEGMGRTQGDRPLLDHRRDAGAGGAGDSQGPMIGAFDGKRVLVVGAGKSGLAAARFCANRGAHVIVSDRRGASELMSASDAVRPDIEWELGGHIEKSFTTADLIVVSPGVPEIAELVAARKAGVEITGEIELASRFIKAP